MRARRAALAVLAVGGLIAVLGVTAISVSGAGHEAEVRITAQRLDDGRTEFALQQREADGGWSERVLPRQRLFPAAARVGRWLWSTALTMRSPGAGDDAGETEVRITAQRLADGRIEFALQEREADGAWGERMLPRVRFFPATVTVGSWLSSTPLMVNLPEVSPDTAEDGGSVASDRAALIALYNATDGESWITNTNWLSEVPLDQWHGITTNSDGRVAELRLIRNELAGPIPAGLVALTDLNRLQLWGNELTGPIPAWLGALTNLERLDLSGNELTGPIPAWLGALTDLNRLQLWGNELTGPIPAELGALTNLKVLSLWGNELTGPIPAELGDLTNLEVLYLSNNELTGPIPAWLGGLTNLESLELWGNELTGPIPAELGALTNLVWLRLGPNELTGPIPAELSALTNLELLILNRNELTGPIPAGLGALTNLQSLWLSDNQLTGPIPAELGALSNLQTLLLSDNQLTGPIPAEFGAPTNLQTLALQNNRLTGPIPAELGDLTNLQRLWLSGNELTGLIPAWLGDLSYLQTLALQNNRLTGPIPARLGDLTEAGHGWCWRRNELTGCRYSARFARRILTMMFAERSTCRIPTSYRRPRPIPAGAWRRTGRHWSIWTWLRAGAIWITSTNGAESQASG